MTKHNARTVNTPSKKNATATKPAKPITVEHADTVLKSAGRNVSDTIKRAVRKATDSVKQKAAEIIIENTPPPATVVALHDAGWGNAVFIRGEGPGLSWEKGIPLVCAENNRWTWTAPIGGEVVFKVLLNDDRWSEGENLHVSPGETVTISPVF